MNTRPQLTPLALLAAPVLALACTVEPIDSSDGFRDGEAACEALETPIMAGQHIHAGQVTVDNTGDALVISASSDTDAGWYFSEVHVYAGTDPVPVNKAGNPAPGQFPYKTQFESPVSQYGIAIPLADLGATCGDTVNIAFHTAMVQLDADGNQIGEETGWGNGDNIGKNWAMGFSYTICCGDDEELGCTLTQGYWKNHHAGASNASQNVPWPIPEDTQLCGQSWLDILHAPPAGGDAWLILAHQWIAAQLNAASGADVPQEVADALAAGTALLEENCGGLSASDAPEAIAAASTLDDYNNGLLGPGHCE